MTATTAAPCCSTPRHRTAGRRCWRSATRSSAGSTGGRPSTPDAASTIIGALAGRATRHPGQARGSGRRGSPTPGSRCCARTGTQAPEIWCRCDGGPHGYLSIAAHAHADALSVEVRYGGVDVLADPGTYCYHGEPAWRSYFRSTIAHNTVELDGQSQSGDGGPFLWLRHANGREIDVADTGEVAELDRGARRLPVAPPAGPAPPLGPAGPGLAQYRHRRRDRRRQSRRPARLPPRPRRPGRARRDQRDPALARRVHAREQRGWNCRAQLRWSLHRGETDPILGWYSGGLGQRVPAVTLLGRGRSAPDAPLATRLEFLDAGKTAKPAFTRSAVSWSASDSLVGDGAGDATRRPDERAGAGPAQVPAASCGGTRFVVAIFAALGLAAGIGLTMLSPPMLDEQCARGASAATYTTWPPRS